MDPLLYLEASVDDSLNWFILISILQICIEDNLLPYPSDTVSFLHDLNYGYQLLKMVRDIDSSNERVKRKVNNVIEEFFVVYAKIGPEPVTLLVQAAGIPSPRWDFNQPSILSITINIL